MFASVVHAVVVALGSGPEWRALGDGIEYAKIPLVESPSVGDGVLHVVRVVPDRVEIQTALASARGVDNRTAGEWADDLGFVVAINAGMFATDQKSNVGYLRSGSHLNNSKWSKTYQSVLAFGPKHASPKVASAALLDLDAVGSKDELTEFETVIQNLRLIKSTGQNVWSPSQRKWSEAAIAIDREGRLLFLFARTPLSMGEFNKRLLQLPLEIVRAMHRGRSCSGRRARRRGVRRCR